MQSSRPWPHVPRGRSSSSVSKAWARRPLLGEALRRLGGSGPGSSFQAGRRRRQRRPDVHPACSRAASRRSPATWRGERILSDPPAPRGGALGGAALGGARAACSTRSSLHVESGEATIVGEIDPFGLRAADPEQAPGIELVRRDSARAHGRRRRSRGRRRGVGRPPRRRRRRRHARRGARPRVRTTCRRRPRPATSSACSSSSAIGLREARRTTIDTGDRHRERSAPPPGCRCTYSIRGRRSSLAQVRRFFEDARARSARGRRRASSSGSRCVKAGLTDPTQAARRLPLRRAHRHRQDRDREGLRCVPLRIARTGSSAST